MSTLAYCSVCGQPYIKPVQPLYKVIKQGKTLHQCSYTCWNKAKEMDLEEHYWLARQRKGNTFSALYIRNNQHQMLHEGDAFICEFEGRRYLLYKQFTGCLLYTLGENEEVRMRVRDLHYVPDEVEIRYISNILNRKSKGAIEDLLVEYGCTKL